VIQTAVERILGFAISANDARMLADAPSIKGVLTDLQDRMGVRRAVPGVSANDAAFQQRLAVAEIAASINHRMGPRARQQLVDQLIEREAAQRAAQQQLETSLRDVGQLLSAFAAESSEFGKFARYCYRLYSEQRATIDAAVSDGATRQRLFGRLDEIYSRFLQEGSNFE
jgi:hypothetical protein